MTYGALNTVTTADADHAWEAITPSNQLHIHCLQKILKCSNLK